MIRLAIRARPQDAEPVLAAVLELAPAGVEQVEEEGFVEYALYGAPGELPALGYGPAEVGGARVEVRGEPVADDWHERWRRFHAPVLVAGRIYVRPPWEEPPERPGVLDLVVDPGQAFGTGAHPTTRMCLELLLELSEGGRAGASLTDLGCGSGVLAIAAAKLGFQPVAALDTDPAALAAADRNARLNGVALARLERLDLRHEPPPPSAIAVANLARPLLLGLATRMARPSALIVSGLLEEEASEVAAAFSPLEERERLTLSGWSAVLLERP